MILSDRSIREEIAAGRLVVEPFEPSMVQPSSVDLRLGRRFLVFRNTQKPFIDVRDRVDDVMDLIEVGEDQPIIIHPKEFVLGSTVEKVTLPDDLVARLDGRSSLGRLGIVIHSTAGFIDPGFSGHITLEMSNLANLPIALYPGMRIAQISFQRMTTPAETPYGQRALGSKYQGQDAPTASRLHLDFSDWNRAKS
ncbi:MAG: dCTP deaminase [Chloroflexi bacterium]|nr:dCTP deaminase [Chloroflexota bacterium]